MKKLLLIFTAITRIGFSQTITQAFNEPVVGDIRPVIDLDTSAFSTGLPIHQTGTNVIWNLQSLVASPPSYSITYLSPAAHPSGTMFPAASAVHDAQDGFNYFLKSTTSPTTQTEILGVVSPFFTTTFTNSAIIMKYPAGIGYSHSDAIAGTITVAAINGNCSGNVTTTADALGTLQLPGGVQFTNVLRVKSVQTLTATQGFFPLGTIKQTMYEFYHSSDKFPIISVSYIRIAPTGSTPTVTARVNGNASLFPTGLTIHSKTALQVYPNPTSGNLFIDLPQAMNAERIIVRSLSGQTMLDLLWEPEINLSQLANGVYLMELQTNEGPLRHKLIKTN